MNSFATFEFYAAGDDDGASIYCVVLHEEEIAVAKQSEFDRFRDQFKNNERCKSSLSEILAQLDRIAEYGVRDQYLRPERAAYALPSKHRKLVSTSYVQEQDCLLRLYVVLLPDNVLVVCGGGQKTADKVRDSPGVQRQFAEAQQIAQTLATRLSEERKPITFDKVEAILETETIKL